MAEDWVSMSRELRIDGGRGRGRTKKTWKQCVDRDRGKYCMLGVKPDDKDMWRKCCSSDHPTHASMKSRRKTD